MHCMHHSSRHPHCLGFPIVALGGSALMPVTAEEQAQWLARVAYYFLHNVGVSQLLPVSPLVHRALDDTFTLPAGDSIFGSDSDAE